MPNLPNESHLGLKSEICWKEMAHYPQTILLFAIKDFTIDLYK